MRVLPLIVELIQLHVLFNQNVCFLTCIFKILFYNYSYKITFAVTIYISVSAKRCPTQFLGPKPNGSVAKGLVFLYSSANVVSSRMNLSGRNFSGLLKNRGSSHICWRQRTNSVWNISLNMYYLSCMWCWTRAFLWYFDF